MFVFLTEIILEFEHLNNDQELLLQLYSMLMTHNITHLQQISASINGKLTRGPDLIKVITYEEHAKTT